MGQQALAPECATINEAECKRMHASTTFCEISDATLRSFCETLDGTKQIFGGTTDGTRTNRNMLGLQRPEPGGSTDAGLIWDPDRDPDHPD